MSLTLARPRDAYRLLVLAATRGLCLGDRLPAPDGAALRALAALSDALQPGRRARAARALEAAFPGRLDAAAKRAIMRDGYRRLWLDICVQCGAVETLPLPDAEVHGLEMLHEARAAGRGVILAESMGFGLRALGKRLLADRGVAVVQVHGPEHFGAEASRLGRWLIGPYFDGGERRFVREILRLPAGDSLAFARALQQRLADGAVVCSAGDGGAGHRFLSVPFLGQTERFPTGVASLARLQGAPILPFFCWEPSPGRAVLEIGEPIAAAPSEDRDTFVERAVRAYANVLEARVRAQPGHYHNWYRVGSLR